MKTLLTAHYKSLALTSKSAFETARDDFLLVSLHSLPIMRAVWSPASRPKLGSVRLPRDPANPASRAEAALNGFQTRAVTFSDAFSIFLAPFLAAATIVNLSWKEKQKKDWDNKLAEIDKEIDFLRARELDTWNRIQLLSANRLATSLGRRSYSTAAVAPAPDSTDLANDTSSEPWGPATEGLPSTLETCSRGRTTQPLFKGRSGRADSQRDDLHVPEVLMELERLVATKLALRMLVQVHTHVGLPSAAFGCNRVSIDHDSSSDIASLLKQLRRIEELEVITQQKASHIRGFIPTSRSDKTFLADEKLQELGASYRNHNLTPTQLVEQISALIVNSPLPPDIIVYTQLIKFFHDQQLDILVPLAISAIQSSRLFIDEVLFERIIEHVGHSREVKVFDWLLSQFTKVDGRILLSQEWEWYRISGQRIPVPSSADRRLVKTLATAALSLEQVPRAEAWVSVIGPADREGKEWANLIKAFLYHCSKHNDWTRGCFWLFEAMNFRGLEINDARSRKLCQTLIFRMLHFCVCCDQKPAYAEILNAAVEADIQPPDFGRRGNAQPDRKIVLALVSEWQSMLERQPYRRNITDESRVRLFQEHLKSTAVYKEVRSPGNGLSQPQQSSSSEQQLSMNDLKAHLSESLQLQESLRTTLTEYVGKAERRSTETHRTEDDKRFEELSTSLTELRRELSRTRRFVELKDREQQDSDGMQKRAVPAHSISGSAKRNENEAFVGDEQLKTLQVQVASLTSLVHSMLEDSPQQIADDSAEDSGYDSDTSSSRRSEEGIDHSFVDQPQVGPEPVIAATPPSRTRHTAYHARQAPHDLTRSPYSQFEEVKSSGVREDEANTPSRGSQVRSRPIPSGANIGKDCIRMTINRKGTISNAALNLWTLD